MKHLKYGLVSLLLAFGASTGTLSAQFMINPNLPVPTPLPATEVSDYGFQANWETLSGVDGYTVHTFIANRAATDGEEYDLFNSDFSYLNNGRTIDDPDLNGTDTQAWVMGSFDDIHRMGWQMSDQIYADGVLGFNNYWKGNGMQGQIMSPQWDLTLGGGKVYVTLTICGDPGANTCEISLKDATPIPNTTLDSKTIPVTTEWTTHTIELNGGVTNGYLYISFGESGNMEKRLCYFFDDLRIYQKYKAGEVCSVWYGYKACPGSNTNWEYVDTDADDAGPFAYAVTSYLAGELSPLSDLVFVSQSTGIDQAATTSSADEPRVKVNGHTLTIEGGTAEAVTVSNVAGQQVFACAAGQWHNGLQLPAGVYVVRVGSHAVKVVTQ